MEFKEIQAKSILTKSKLPGTDYVVNPYLGCRFGCVYCYASFMGRFADKSVSDWGEYVYAKANAPELLKKEAGKLKNNGRGKTILLSSVTDPYQPMEAKYKLTRQCLQALAQIPFEGEVSILTKSNLVLRDVDVLRQLKRVEVGLTVTTTDDAISRYFEKYAPPASARLEALKTLHQEGIRTYAFVGPLLPHFAANETALDALLESIAETGTKELFVEHINLRPYILNRFLKETQSLDRKAIESFYSSQSKDYRKPLDGIVQRLVKKHKLRLITNQTLYHPEGG